MCAFVQKVAKKNVHSPGRRPVILTEISEEEGEEYQGGNSRSRDLEDDNDV
jgi:hypothetical protein